VDTSEDDGSDTECEHTDTYRDTIKLKSKHNGTKPTFSGAHSNSYPFLSQWRHIYHSTVCTPTIDNVLLCVCPCVIRLIAPSLSQSVTSNALSMIDGVKARTDACLRANVAGTLSRSASGVTSSPNAGNDDDEGYIKLITTKNNKRKHSLASNKSSRQLSAKKKVKLVRNCSPQSAPAVNKKHNSKTNTSTV